jgi:hypothetical protein
MFTQPIAAFQTCQVFRVESDVSRIRFVHDLSLQVACLSTPSLQILLEPFENDWQAETRLHRDEHDRRVAVSWGQLQREGPQYFHEDDLRLRHRKSLHERAIVWSKAGSRQTPRFHDRRDGQWSEPLHWFSFPFSMRRMQSPMRIGTSQKGSKHPLLQYTEAAGIDSVRTSL